MEAICQCGATTYTTSLPAPTVTYICHCTWCRAQSGSAFGVTAGFPLPSTLPSPSLPFPYSLFPPSSIPSLSTFSKITNAGKTVHLCFCKLCGVRLVHVDEGADSLAVKAGTLIDFDWTNVWKGTHIYCRSKVVDIPDEAVQWETEPPGE